MNEWSSESAKDHALPHVSPVADSFSNSQKVTTWELRLYVAGQTPRSMTAIANLERICQEHLQGQYHLEVIDLMENPELAAEDSILAIPTLVRRLPPPVRRVIGDLSDQEKVLVSLRLLPHPAE